MTPAGLLKPVSCDKKDRGHHDRSSENSIQYNEESGGTNQEKRHQISSKEPGHTEDKNKTELNAEIQRGATRGSWYDCKVTGLRRRQGRYLYSRGNRVKIDELSNDNRHNKEDCVVGEGGWAIVRRRNRRSRSHKSKDEAKTCLIHQHTKKHPLRRGSFLSVSRWKSLTCDLDESMSKDDEDEERKNLIGGDFEERSKL